MGMPTKRGTLRIAEKRYNIHSQTARKDLLENLYLNDQEDLNHGRIFCFPKTNEDIMKLYYEIPNGPHPFAAEKYGERLSTLREKRGLTQQDLAKTIDREIQAISQIEKGQRKSINNEYVKKFAMKLECSCAYLLGYTEDENGYWYEKESKIYTLPFIPYSSDEVISRERLLSLMEKNMDMVDLCTKILSLSERKKKHMKTAVEAILEMINCEK